MREPLERSRCVETSSLVGLNVTAGAGREQNNNKELERCRGCRGEECVVHSAIQAETAGEGKRIAHLHKILVRPLQLQNMCE